jgi:hypothetical protein
MTRKRSVAQAWIERTTADPEATSAWSVARAHLGAGRTLVSLRRLRLFELAGLLPARATLEKLLHRSIQFYNPIQERCTLRAATDETPPLRPRERALLVFERGEERRGGAERWWRHETGKEIEVREGVAWLMTFEGSPAQAAGAMDELAELRDRRHGLLCNPHAQEMRRAADGIPLPWFTEAGG